jgi:hypothetical protein
MSMIRSCPDRLEFKNECYSTVNQSISKKQRCIRFNDWNVQANWVRWLFLSNSSEGARYVHRGSQLYFHIARYMLKEKGEHFFRFPKWKLNFGTFFRFKNGLVFVLTICTRNSLDRPCVAMPHDNLLSNVK